MHVRPVSEIKLAVVLPAYPKMIDESGFHTIGVAGTPDFGDSSPSKSRPVVYDPYRPEAVPGEDYGSPFDYTLEGWWNEDMETRDFAHEVGHLMGLADDYRRLPDGDFEALDGREGTLMGGGDAIDQSLVDRLGDLVAKIGTKLPTCWSGTIHSTSTQVWHQYGGSLRCTEIWNLSLGFTTDKNGIVTGSGTGTFDHLQNCHASFPWDFTNASTMSFDVKGKLMTDSVELLLVETAIDGQTQGLLNYTLVVNQNATLGIPITSPGVADGTVTIHASVENGARATGVHVVHLECQGCAAA